MSPNCPSSLRRGLADRRDFARLGGHGAVKRGELLHRLDLIRRGHDVVAIEQ
jgi:hypothetical protein